MLTSDRRVLELLYSRVIRKSIARVLTVYNQKSRVGLLGLAAYLGCVIVLCRGYSCTAWFV